MRRFTIAGLLALVLLLAGFAVPADATSVKPMLRGLLDRKGMPASTYFDELDGFVVKVDWTDLQPDAFGPLAADNAIDQALAAVRTTPGASQLQLKLRVLGGVSAPDWAKHLGGDPVNVYRGAHVFTMGRFWTADYGDAYADLQQKLAARYDGAPEVAETVMSRCTIMTAEPFLRADRADTRTRDALLAAGFTVKADTQCLHQQTAAHRVWKRTRSALSADPYDSLAPDGTYTTDVDFTRKQMQYCRKKLGARCVLENDSVSSPLLPEPYPTLYGYIEDLGAPIAYQTRNAQRIGDAMAALNWAADHGANHVELNTDYPNYDLDQLRAVRQRLRANPTG
ncbi:MAG TPA: hypothetical protein VHC63_18905 [Acidimicrobiales bacterium]|nr:hypothetical protein [Acidimicrobiales bacterium]